MGRWHAYYARRAGARIVAVADPSEAAARALARGAATFTDARAMFAAAKPDVVHVCTPLSTHVEIARSAVEAGVHALVEKPLAATADETRRLLEAARERGVHVCPVHQFAFQPAVARAAEALPTLGEPLHASFTIHSAGGDARDASAWDAIVADVIPHPLSVLQALWPSRALLARDWSAQRPGPGELHVRGACGALPVSAWFSMSARPTRCDMELACTAGAVQVNFFHGYAIVRRGTPSRAEKIGQPFRLAAGTLATAAANLAGRALRGEVAYPGLAALVRAFHAAARGEAPAPVAPGHALAVAELRDHLVRGGSSGARPG